MALHILHEWRSHIESILAEPGITVLVGESDTGKTSFCTLLANAALSAGVPTAIVDGDIGQSEIGPPSTIGFGLIDAEFELMSQIPPRGLYFVGNTSPFGHMLSLATGVKLVTDRAVGSGRDLVIVDTTGLVRGVSARKLKTNKLELLAPKHIVALQKHKEAEHFLRLFDTWTGCTVHRIKVSPKARSKTPAIRSQRRAVRFQEYFMHSHSYDISFEGIATTGTWLHTGIPMEPKYIKFLERVLETAVFHCERLDGGLYVVTKDNYNRQRIPELQEEFHTKSIVVVPAGWYANLLIGLQDEQLRTIAIGIVKGIDFRSRVISIFTPLKTMTPVRSIRFGVLKLRPDGTEIGRLRPGEF